MTKVDIDEKIKEVKKERNMTEADFAALLETAKKLVKEGKFEEGIIDIFKTYTDAIHELNEKLNILFEWKGEAKK